MAGLSASGLKTQIRSYTEVDSNVLSDSVLENIILNAQYRIFRDVPIYDAPSDDHCPKHTRYRKSCPECKEIMV